MSLGFLFSKNNVNSICKKCAHNVKTYGKVRRHHNRDLQEGTSSLSLRLVWGILCHEERKLNAAVHANRYSYNFRIVSPFLVKIFC